MISSMLVAFVSISLVVSSIMIGVITYISVLERRKEIGILRAIGASKMNVSEVFNAETFIIGLCSGVMGIVLSEILLIPGLFNFSKTTWWPSAAERSPRADRSRHRAHHPRRLHPRQGCLQVRPRQGPRSGDLSLRSEKIPAGRPPAGIFILVITTGSRRFRPRRRSQPPWRGGTCSRPPRSTYRPSRR